ncbi:MAG: Dyp-type peroxidase [Sandaracinaceae bacterium]
MAHPQPGILAALPPRSRHLFFRLAPGIDDASLRVALRALASIERGPDAVIGLGPSVVALLGRNIPGLRELPSVAAHGVAAPSTPQALWCWLRGTDSGELLHRGRALTQLLEPTLALDHAIDTFTYTAEGRDLSGFVDGTENPEGEEAEAAALAHDRGIGLDGSSVVAVQKWVHDLDRLEAMRPEERDHVFGRRASDEVELEDAPPSAHVKRTAQESFEPPAFVVRRSQPYVEPDAHGLVFVAFGRTLDAFEAQWRRMLGLEDGITDALFRFTRPVTGAAFWCPPLEGGRLDLRALGL